MLRPRQYRQQRGACGENIFASLQMRDDGIRPYGALGASGSRIFSRGDDGAVACHEATGASARMAYRRLMSHRAGAHQMSRNNNRRSIIINFSA